MSILLCVYGGWLANMLLGAVILAAVDDDEQRLYRWYADCPLKNLGPLVMLTLWPAMAFIAWKMRQQPNNK